MLAVDDAEEDPIVRSPRTSVMLVAELKHFGLEEVTKHRVRDISARGARVDGASFLSIGEPVAVTVGDLHGVAAKVVWRSGQTAGLRRTRNRRGARYSPSNDASRPDRPIPGLSIVVEADGKTDPAASHHKRMIRKLRIQRPPALTAGCGRPRDLPLSRSHHRDPR